MEDDKQKHKYIFPNILAKMMAKTSQRTQYESSMMSMFFILLGIIVSSLYTIIFTDFNLFWKISVGFNAFFGFIFLTSSLVTTYQQYTTYMEAIDPGEFLKEQTKEKEVIEKEIEEEDQIIQFD